MRIEPATKEEGDYIFEELRKALREQPVLPRTTRLATSTLGHSAKERDVVLVGKGKVTALQSGLPDDECEAALNCTYLAHYYASSRAKPDEPAWAERYAKFMTISGWPMVNQTIQTQKDHWVGRNTIASVTFALLHEVKETEMGEFMAHHLRAIEGNSASMKRFHSPTHEKTASFQMLPVKGDGRGNPTLVFTSLATQSGSERDWGKLRNVVDFFSGSHDMTFQGRASRHSLDEQLYQTRLPTIKLCMDELALTGYSDIAENFNASVRR